MRRKMPENTGDRKVGATTTTQWRRKVVAKVKVLAVLVLTLPRRPVATRKNLSNALGNAGLFRDA